MERLHELVKIVKDGEQVFITVGCALAEIKERKLFLGWPDANFETFEEFCGEVFGYSRQYATKLLGAAVAVKGLPEKEAVKITSAKAAAAIAKVDPTLRAAVVNEATKGGKLATAAAIKKATPASATPPPRKKSGPPASKPKPAQDEPKDRTGLIIPEGVRKLWDRGEEVQSLLTYLSAIKGALEKKQAFGDPENPKQADPLFAEVNFSGALSYLDQAYAEIKVGKPFAVCATCQGKLPGKCTACKGRGFVSEFYWSTCVTKEAKDIRDSIVSAQDEE